MWPPGAAGYGYMVGQVLVVVLEQCKNNLSRELMDGITGPGPIDPNELGPGQDRSILRRRPCCLNQPNP